jgi:hypothetical protein
MYMYIVLNLDQCVTLFDHAVFIIVKYQKKCTVKPVYSGHLGEIDKMTTIYR